MKIENKKVIEGENLRRGVKAALVGLITSVLILAASGCSTEEDSKYGTPWCVLEENGHNVLYELDKWADFESTDFIFFTKDGQYVWGELENATFYHDKPGRHAYDFEAKDAANHNPETCDECQQN